MAQTTRPVQFNRSKIIHEGTGTDGHTTCGRSGGWQGGFYGVAVDVTCKRCLSIIAKREEYNARQSYAVGVAESQDHVMHAAAPRELSPEEEYESDLSAVRHGLYWSETMDEWHVAGEGISVSAGTRLCYGNILGTLENGDFWVTPKGMDMLGGDVRKIYDERNPGFMETDYSAVAEALPTVADLLPPKGTVYSAIIDQHAPNGFAWPQSVRTMTEWVPLPQHSEDAIGQVRLMLTNNASEAVGWLLPDGTAVVTVTIRGRVSTAYMIVPDGMEAEEQETAQPYRVSAMIQVRIPGLTNSEGGPVHQPLGRMPFIIEPGYSTEADIPKMIEIRHGYHAEGVVVTDIKFLGTL